MNAEPLIWTEEQTRLARSRSQRLDPQAAGEISQVARAVGAVCGLQAQDLPAAVLGVRARSTGLTAVDVERARLEERSVVRTWCQRGTLHLLASEDLAWLLQLLGPVFLKGGRRRLQQLGLDEQDCQRGVRIIREALADQGPLERGEIAAVLQSRGVPAQGQAAYHLIHRAALEGILCQGPERGSQATYVLVENWIGSQSSVSPGAALGELARRYLEGYGPAGPDDLAAWSGLPAGEARRAWQLAAGQMVEVEAGGKTAWALKDHREWLQAPPSASPGVRLLPRFDAYLLGWSSREGVIEARFARRIHPGGGILHPALLVDGCVRGVWQSRRRRGALEVTVDPFEDLPAGSLPGLQAEVEDLGRFLGMPSTFQKRRFIPGQPAS